nr:MAG TPA: hypothetical protein [Caudoviricetes sp.]
MPLLMGVYHFTLVAFPFTQVPCGTLLVAMLFMLNTLWY